jgi:hypothetical protein
VGRCGTRSIRAGNDGRVTLGKEGPTGNPKVGGGGDGTGNKGSRRIHSRHPRIRNNAAYYHPCRSRTLPNFIHHQGRHVDTGRTWHLTAKSENRDWQWARGWPWSCYCRRRGTCVYGGRSSGRYFRCSRCRQFERMRIDSSIRIV